MSRTMTALTALCVVGALTVGVTAWRGGGSPMGAAASATSVPLPTVTVPGLDDDGLLPWAAPLTVVAEDGTLAGVDLVGDDALPGRVADATTWRASRLLGPDAERQLRVRVVDAGGEEHALPLRVRTTAAERVLGVRLTPGDDAVVGVGQPVAVHLDGPVSEPADRAAVERRLAVTSTPSVEGAWRWMADDRLHWRPADLWPAGTAVKVRADLQGLALSDGTWVDVVRTADFAIGERVVSTVDVAAHTLTVRRGDEVLRVLPASMGKPEHPTRGGTHLVLEKDAERVMDSDTVGLPGAYRTTVQWAVRLTYSGTFTHSAPWSVADQGVRNVSHGCINLSPDDARWFYEQVRRGDVVEVVNASEGPKLDDPGAADWNLTFAQWQAGSALPR